MELSTGTFYSLLLACAGVVAVCAVVTVYLIARLQSDFRRAVRPTLTERAAQLRSQAEANRAVLDTPAGRDGLVEFFVSEANISAFFRETEERIESAQSEEELRRVLQRLKSVDEKKPWYNLDNLKRGAKAIGEKLFDKANDIVKPYLGGAGEK